MMALDVTLSLGAVFVATGFVGWRLLGRKATPACHPPPSDAVAPVVVKGALARGLSRAQQKRREGERG